MTLSKGIKHYKKLWETSNKYIFDNDYLSSYLEKVSKIIKLMRFFGIENLYGTSIEQYTNHYNNAKNDFHEMRLKELENREVNAEEALNQIKNRYFNFDNFNNSKFENIFHECTNNKNIYTLDEVINININLEDNKTFIVFLRKNNKVCFIGRTTNLLNYIGVKNKEYDADSVSFYAIDNDYIDDVYVKAHLEFNVATSCTIKHTNKKYITLKSVKRIFKEIYRINLYHIKKIIAQYNIEKFIIGDVIFLDKIELDKATRKYLSLEDR